MSSSSCLRLLPRLPVTSIPLSIFPSVTYFRRHFLHKIWPIQLAFFSFISCRIFLSSLTLRTRNNTSFLTRSVQLIFSIFLQHHTSKLSGYFWYTFQSVQVSASYNATLQMQQFTSFLFKFTSNVLYTFNTVAPWKWLRVVAETCSSTVN